MTGRSRKAKVLLIFHSTRSDNLGVGALTVSDVEIVRSAARRAEVEVTIDILDWRDPREPYLSGPDISVREIDGKYIFGPTGYLADARRADVVIDIGAGDSFADIYGSRRLSRLFAMKFITHLAGTPLVVAPQTIGPFTKGLSKRLARATLSRSAVVATRDAMSTACVREIGVRRAVVEASDVALRLPFTAPAERAPGPIRVGLNVSGLLMAGGYTRSNMFGLSTDYATLMERLIGSFLAHPSGCEVHLVPHVIVDDPESPEDDYAASQRLVEKFPALRLAPRFRSPSEAKSYIAGMDFFSGARMHSCIAAFSSGVPVVPLAYSRKFAGLFGSLGYDRTVDSTSEPADEIVGRIMAGYEDRDRLRAEVAVALEAGRAKLQAYEDALVGLLKRD